MSYYNLILQDLFTERKRSVHEVQLPPYEEMDSKKKFVVVDQSQYQPFVSFLLLYYPEDNKNVLT